MSSEALADAAEDGGVPALRVRDVVKHYLMFDHPEDRLKQMVVPRIERLLGRPPRRYFRDFLALGGISFDVPRGQTVGIVGRNGSGKSTLLQIVCGTLAPTHGSAEANGRIAALLELGAGFNPDFSGRENVYLYASILGVPRREIEWRFEHITRFADIGVFIDQPVRTYSSGMYVRLAFATAINVDPDILVVDEALAVGDEAFQRKCFARIEELREQGCTILFVSHSAQTVVQLCDRAILIDAGELLLDGRPKVVVNQYQRLINSSGPETEMVREEIRMMALQDAEGPSPEGKEAAANRRKTSAAFDPNLRSQSTVVYKEQGAKIRDFRLLSVRGEAVNTLDVGQEYVFAYRVDFEREARDVGFGMLVSTISGFAIGGIGTQLSARRRVKQISHGASFEVRMRFCCSLLPGVYTMNAGVFGSSGDYSGYLNRVVDALIFRVNPVEDLIASGVVDLRIEPEVTSLD